MLRSPNLQTEQPPPNKWAYGEHVSVIGDTGSGKTFLIGRLIRQRNYVVFLQTKSDPTVDEYEGFERRKRARAMDNLQTSHIILKPEFDHQQEEIGAALLKVWKQGGWTTVIDELLYIERLKLTKSVERLLTQGRSEQVSTVVGMQRPVAVTRFAISQSTHVFCFVLEGRDIAIMAESTSPKVAKALLSLNARDHDFVYFNRRTREVTTGNARNLDEVILGASGIF
jgi:ABC-type phosphate/phosphonate transport system ATPase subunit